MRQVSVLVSRATEEIEAPEVILQRRAETDETGVREALEAIGYWSARVEATLDTGARPARARLAVTLGPRYRIADYVIREPEDQTPRIVIDRAVLGVESDAPAAGTTIVGAEEKLRAAYFAAGYPLATTRDRRVVIDHAARVAHVSVTVDPGVKARIGSVTVTGLEAVSEAHVRRQLGFATGDPLTSAAIEKARASLVESGLFRTVRISYPREPGAGDTLPVTVELGERPHRSIGAGAAFSTNEGASVKAFWEHRNLWNEGERVRVAARLGQKDSGLETTFRKPDFMLPGQALLVSLQARDSETEAFDIRSYGGSALVERKLGPSWKGSFGVSYERAYITRRGIERQEDLLGLPLTITRDTTTDPLDPTAGSRLKLGATPYAPIGVQDTAFLVLSVRHTFYHSLDKEGDIVAAGWVGAGSILGGQLADIPLSRRFFAGGGGSVRGFGYQLAGPVDAGRDPVGGTGLVEFGGEVRFRITESIGIVPFIEAGTVSDSALPSLGGRLFWGTGLGVRYYTPIGPLRLDLAVPLNPRKDIDDAFQIYVSLGQAF